MYESHFGFSGSPFQLNPDPAFYFNSRGHGHALAYLRYGVSQGEGFIVVTGEIGAGKTTLLRALLGELDRAQVVAAQIVSTQLESGDLLQAIITAFGIPTNGNGKASLIATLEAFLMTLATQGRRALLIIDEAQNLEIRAIEELRMLSNFQLGTQSLLQSFLVGQPELRKKLESPEMEQLRQRVTASCHLGPLGPEETQAYVEHRLKRVGWIDRPSFVGDAFDHIYRWSGGVPRRINRLCNRLLLAAFLEGRSGIDASLVEATAKELRQEIGEASFEPIDLPARQEPPASSVKVVEAPAEAGTSEDRNPEAGAVANIGEAMEVAVTQPHVQTQPVKSALSTPVCEAPTPVQDAPLAQPEPSDSLPATVSSEAAIEAVEPQGEPVHPVSTAADAPAADTVATPADSEEAPVDALSKEPSEVQVVRVHRPDARQNVPTLLCVAGDQSEALKFALIAKVWATKSQAPKLVLVNPGVQSQGWPWEGMASLLPAFELAVHLGRRIGTLEATGGDIFSHFAEVIDELAPRGVLVLGESDAVLSCALVARKRDIPVLRLEAGLERDGEALNASLIEQCSDAIFTPSTAGALQRLHERGVPASRVFAVPGSLSTDLMQTLSPAMTTPYGAFLRHRLPIFLGPRWSAEVDGTAYGLISLSLEGLDAAAVESVMQTVTGLSEIPKLIWLTDSQTRSAIRGWQTNHPERADELFLIEDSLPRAELDRRNSAHILCCDIRSLPDQFSIMRGAVCVIAESGQAVSMGALEAGVPVMLLQDGRVQITAPGQDTLIRPLSSVVLNEALRGFAAQEVLPPTSPAEADACIAATVLAARLHRWMDGRLRADWVPRPTDLLPMSGNVPAQAATVVAAA